MKRIVAILLVASLLISLVGGSVVLAQEPTAEPTEEPTAEPTQEPTAEPTEEPTAEPTQEPIAEPTEEPTAEPTEEPTAEPTAEPTEEPTAEMTEEPTISAAAASDGPWYSTIYVSNPHASSATVAILFYDENGNQDASYDVSGGLSAHGSAVIDVSSVGGLDSSWQGSAVVQSERQLAAAVALKVNSSTDRELYSGFTQAGTSAYMPAVANAYGQLSTLAVQNTSGSSTTVTATYLSTTGGANPTFSFTVPAYASKFLVSNSDNGVGGPSLGSGWLGSASFTSSGGEIVVLNHQPYTNAPKAVAYEGVSQGYTKIYYPTALQKIYTAKFTTFYAIQNVGSASTSVTMRVYDTSGVQVGTASTTLASNAKVSWQPADAGASEGFLGSAVVESGGQPIAGIVNIGTLPMSGCPTGAGQTTAFTAPGEGAANVAIPWVEYKSGTDWRSFLAVQNIGTGTSGNVTVTYYNANGSVAATQALGTIPSGSKGNSNPNTAGAGSSFVGSAEVTSNNSSDQLIVLTNNQQADQCHGASLIGASFTP